MNRLTLLLGLFLTSAAFGADRVAVYQGSAGGMFEDLPAGCGGTSNALVWDDVTKAFECNSFVGGGTDADTLDGLDSLDFLRDNGDTGTGNYSFTGTVSVGAAGATLQLQRLVHTDIAKIEFPYATTGGSGNDPAAMYWHEPTSDVGILQIELGDDGGENDSIIIGGGGTGGSGALRFTANGKIFFDSTPSDTPTWEVDLYASDNVTLFTNDNFMVANGKDICIQTSGPCLSTRVGNHDLLGNPEHTDTQAGTEAHADLITYDTDHWERFPRGETKNYVLFSGDASTLPRWVRVDQCTISQKLQYTDSTGEFTCVTDQTGGGGGGGGNFDEVTVDFGATPNDMETATVTSSWVVDTSKVICHATMLVTADRLEGAEDALVEQVGCAIHDRSTSTTSFDVTCHAPSTTTGEYVVHCTGG